MKVFVAAEGNEVSHHFGHCTAFAGFVFEGSNLVAREEVLNPGHKPGVLPKLLKDHQADVIISGGMGGRAIALFEQAGIQAITGASGDPEAIAKAYIRGELAEEQSECDEHAHRGEGHGGCND